GAFGRRSRLPSQALQSRSGERACAVLAGEKTVSPDISSSARAHKENWPPILDLAVEEVFEIMLGCRLTPAAPSEHAVHGEFTAMVGLAGSLCGVLTVRCDAETARQIAKSMLGDAADAEQQVADALGEICNMIAGNFESGAAQMKSSSQAAF